MIVNKFIERNFCMHFLQNTFFLFYPHEIRHVAVSIKELISHTFPLVSPSSSRQIGDVTPELLNHLAR